MDRRRATGFLSVLIAVLASGVATAQDGWLKGEFRPIAKKVTLTSKGALRVPRVQVKPDIDGALIDAVWKKAARITRLPYGTQGPKGRTEVFIAADKQKLYIACRCYEPNMKSISCKVTEFAPRNNRVFYDDSVEIFIDPTGAGTKNYQFIINPIGGLYYAENEGLGLAWEAEFEAEVGKGKDSWSAEFALPFDILGVDGKRPNTVMKMQFCRTATPRPVKETTSWRPGWSKVANFGAVVIDPQGRIPALRDVSLGSFCLGRNTLTIGLQNFPKGIYETRLAIDGKPLCPPILSGGDERAQAAYRLAGRSQTKKLIAELTVTRKDTRPPRPVESLKRALYVPIPLAVSLHNAHVALNGKTRVWIRVLAGDASPPKLRATVLDAGENAVQSIALPPLPAGTAQGWFEFRVAGLPAGAYGLLVESDEPRATATAKFWVEKVDVPQRASVSVLLPEPVGRDWRSFPVSVGVPFPRSTLDSVERVRLVDEAGREVPSQVARTSTWNADNRDVRWLLLDFLADAKQKAGGSYRLEYGRDVKRAPVAKPVRVTETPDLIALDTGALSLVVDRKRASIIKQISVNGRRVIAGRDGGVYLQNQKRKVFCSAWDKAPPEITVEKRGPIRAVVRQQGWYAAKDGERLCRYDIRVHVFKGCPFVKIYHTWILTHDSRKVQFGDISMRFPLAERPEKCAFGVDQHYETPPFEARLDRQTRVNLVHEDSNKFTVSGWRGKKRSPLKRGKYAGGWVGATSKSFSVVAHLRDMWQNYPAELEVTPDAVAVHFWPEHGFSYKYHDYPERRGAHRWPYTDGPFMDLQPKEYIEKVLMTDKEKIWGYDKINALGMTKTQEIWLDLGASSRSASALQERARKYEQPLAGVADPKWIGASGVFRPFAAVDDKSFPHVERAIRARWDSQDYLQHRIHDYGWLHYGDRHQSYPFPGPDAKKKGGHRYWLVSDYRCGMEPWLMWARSGERRYFRWGEMVSRHIMDVDAIHWSSTDVRPPRRKGQFYPMSYGHYCSSPSTWNCHNEPVGYNMMYYYLTGYRRALDVLTESGEMEVANCNFAGPGISRAFFVTGHNQMDLYRMTWDERYWKNAFLTTTRSLDHLVANKPIGAAAKDNHLYELARDIDEFTGDSRLKPAVLNVVHGFLGSSRGERAHPFLYMYGHAYALTGDPKYIAHAKGKLETFVYPFSLSEDPARRGRHSDNVTALRIFRQVPGFLDYMKRAEAKHGVIERRTPTPKFYYLKGPIYFQEEKDHAFSIKLHLDYSRVPKEDGEVVLTAPNGKTVLTRRVGPEHIDRRTFTGDVIVGVPKDNQTGTYRLDNRSPTAGGPHWYTVSCPAIPKIAHQLPDLDYSGGHIFFYVPQGTKRFNIRVLSRIWAGGVSQPVLLGPNGKEAARLEGRRRVGKGWDNSFVEVRPKPEDTGGLWCLIAFGPTEVSLRGVPPFVWCDTSQFFLPKGDIVQGAARAKQ